MFVGRGEMKITQEKKKTKSRERVMSSLSALVKSTYLLKGAKSLFFPDKVLTCRLLFFFLYPVRYSLYLLPACHKQMKMLKWY
jgi:hypothetical protein